MQDVNLSFDQPCCAVLCRPEHPATSSSLNNLATLLLEVSSGAHRGDTLLEA